METSQFISILAFIFGAAVGSFLNVVILRLPEEESSLAFPASHCPACKTSLSWYENIPILSYLFLRGKCSHCKVKISLQYPIVELSTGLLTLALYHKFGLTIEGFGYFLFCAALVVIIWIDIYHQIIPDILSLPGIVIGFLFSFITPYVTPQSSILGILLGAGVLYAVAYLYFIIRKQEGMGMGDVKLLGMIGAFLGYQSLLFVIFFSSFTGTICGLFAMAKQGKGSATRIPFGPFLSIAAIIFLFFNQEIYYYFTLYLKGELF